MPDAPKIQIDSDWKAEAQKEKDRLTKVEAEKAKARPAARGAAGAAGDAEGAGGPEGLPPADFRTIVSMLAQQAIMGLGVLADRKTGGIIVDLEGARFAIDLLDVLEQKTKGNLTKEEADELRQILADLRTRFVQVATMVSKQVLGAPPAVGAAASGAAESPVIPAAAAPASMASPIITD